MAVEGESPAKSVAESVAGSSSDVAAGCATFNCAKCGEACPLSEMVGVSKRAAAGRLVVEKICSNTYKSLSKRWGKNPKLRQWWQAKTEAERTQIFKEHKRIVESSGVGSMRDFEVEVASTAESSVGKAKKRIIHWKPFSLWSQDSCLSVCLHVPRSVRSVSSKTFRVSVVVSPFRGMSMCAESPPPPPPHAVHRKAFLVHALDCAVRQCVHCWRCAVAAPSILGS